MWNIPLSGMLLYAKSKIPILAIRNRPQFRLHVSNKLQQSNRYQLSKDKDWAQRTIQPSQWQAGELWGFYFLYIPGVQEQEDPPWIQQTVTTCLAFPGVKSLHSPGRPHPALGTGKGQLQVLCTAPPQQPCPKGQRSQLLDPVVLALHTSSFITHHLETPQLRTKHNSGPKIHFDYHLNNARH